MFTKLQQKWKVTKTDLVLILCTFAVTGTLTAWLSRQITSWLAVDKYSIGWWSLKIGVLLFGYQIIILLVGFCFGQFQFFWNYEKKILRRMGILKDSPMRKRRIAVFASGGGSNARQIMTHFATHPSIDVALVVCNKPGAGVLAVAAEAGIPTLLINRSDFYGSGTYLATLQQKEIDFIALAGFLWKVPAPLLAAYPGKIVNIHPALLPKHGGQGMYGHYVHEAVLAAGDTESGITIHYVDEQYDHGTTILQVKCPVLADDTAETLAKRVLGLEHEHYAASIEGVVVSY